MKDLNLAGNRMGMKSGLNRDGADMGGFIAISDAIPTMGAMTKLTISGDEDYAAPITIETSMIKADFSSKYLGASGASMLAAFLPKCQ